MWRLTCIFLIIGFGYGQEVPSKQQNATKEENNINKRYIIAPPQYNSLLYTNSQVLPSEQLFFQQFPNYINNFQVRTPYGIVPNYYFLPRNDYVQNIVPQFQNNIVPAVRQVVQQKIVPQQAIPQQVVPQQVVPQQVVPQQVVPQRSVPQLIPQQLVVQQAVPQPIVQQRLIPQVVPQRVVLPQQVIQYENTLPVRQHQQVVPSIVPAQQQQVPIALSRAIQTPVQYQVYQPQPRPQVVVRNEPYPYEVPLGQSKIPVTSKQPPIFVKPQVYLQRPQNFYPLPNSYFQQSAINNQPQTVYVNPTLQSPGGTQQIVRIGYSHPQQQVLYNSQPHSVYVNPNFQTSTGGTPQVVRIGYGHLQLNQDEVLEDQNGGQARVKYAVPVTYRVVPSQLNGSNNQYESSDRSTRTVGSTDKEQVKQKEADVVKA